MGYALKRHQEGSAVVIPAILRAVDREAAPFHGLQVSPKDAIPVTLWADRDSAWRDVGSGIRKAGEECTRRDRATA
jgi:hypothetical protein